VLVRRLLYAQLGEHLRHVRLHGAVGDVEPLADRPIGEPFGGECQYLALPRAQLRALTQ